MLCSPMFTVENGHSNEVIMVANAVVASITTKKLRFHCFLYWTFDWLDLKTLECIVSVLSSDWLSLKIFASRGFSRNTSSSSKEVNLFAIKLTSVRISFPRANCKLNKCYQRVNYMFLETIRGKTEFCRDFTFNPQNINSFWLNMSQSM